MDNRRGWKLAQIEFGEHWISHLGPLEVHMDTLVTTWISMILLILLALVITRNLNRIPDGLQSFAEMVMEFVEGISIDQMGKEGCKHVALIASLFLFILVGNLLGQLPWRIYHLQQGEFASPTNDLNVTVGLALIVSAYYFIAGISKKGLRYFKHYLEPFWFLLPINMLEDLTRPLTLSLRLFGNILAGEVIILIALAFVPLLAPIPVMLFELFVAFLQAFIFTILSASYIGAVLAEHDH
ncbi:MAG: ATP synthase F0 subunit A [Candidatus Melainabacteria bacterium RIFOXYA12_FULL_32_12]|nr:MAG: ATP synthase F0 subunit A [Candidatus Melainabacteria bacterium RIFOXYA2_FULL_32_9]OGI28805.1 MAG: ATP synthase F0 subunit A [Candidatus Melainabacteria bacterium RIFOXYA12_FULL_32_12]